MGDFQKIAEEISEHILSRGDRKEIRPQDIADIGSHVASGIGGGVINCYPGIPSSGCYPFALFVSLKSPDYIRPNSRGHLTCRKAMEKIVQHMQGSCFKKTKSIVFITDFWDGAAWNVWRGNFKEIDRSVNIEIYLMTGRGRVSRVEI